MDNRIPMFDNMYMKRLKAYKQIGYELSSGLKADKQIVNAIYGEIIIEKLSIRIYLMPIKI